MKIPNAEQIRALDKLTIEKYYNSSIELMEKASNVFVEKFIGHYPDTSKGIVIFCGSGNNGGDGLAIARILNQKFYKVLIYYCQIGTVSSDNLSNFQNIPKRSGIIITNIVEADPFPIIGAEDIIIDAIFGQGLNRPIENYWGKLIDHINQSGAEIISVDVPSGLFLGSVKSDSIIRANRTISFEFPKLVFMLPEYEKFISNWEYTSIGLDSDEIDNLKVFEHYLEIDTVKSILKKRGKFSHKGTYGHALLIMSKYGMVGAAILAGKATLRSGTGLVSIHAPRSAYQILQTAIPEAIVSVDQHEYHFSTVPKLKNYSAIGIGCGLGKEVLSKEALAECLGQVNSLSIPLLIDADALNIISENTAMLDTVPHGTILSPHPKECKRLFGTDGAKFKDLVKLKEESNKRKIYIILKRANTVVICPDGNMYFNSTGNPGMATAGSGDVLSGLITGLLAQSYSSKEACLLAVFLHGMAADLAVESLRGQEALIASDIIEYFGHAFLKIHQS